MKIDKNKEQQILVDNIRVINGFVDYGNAPEILCDKYGYSVEQLLGATSKYIEYLVEQQAQQAEQAGE